ncbi:hypothetical protein KY284_010457 [Solanum tuberosum]|nr:hypothetical protein KY284_010457 [Solanum tuberosum]
MNMKKLETFASWLLENQAQRFRNHNSSRWVWRHKRTPDNLNLEGPKKEHRKKTKGKWYLDSGCSNHKTGDKNLFKSVVEYKGGNIHFGDNSKGTDLNTIY